MTTQILSNDSVRLVRGLPELCLPAGAIGVVRSAWFYPNTAYEVEFAGHGRNGGTRLLLLEGDVAPVERETSGADKGPVEQFAMAFAG